MIHASPPTNPLPGLATVTVCLDDLPGLQATFESLRAQTRAPEQWIVADGGSTDGTRDWLTHNDWPGLRWTSERDGGIYEGMNRGLREARADYVLFLNSGDVLANPIVLESVADAIANAGSRPSLLYGDCLELDVRGATHFRRARRPGWVPIGMPTSHQAMYFRRDAIGEGYDTQFRLSGDYAAVVKLYRVHRGSDFTYLPAVLCRAQLGGRSEQKRREGLREDFEIRRTLLGMSAPASGALRALHLAHAWIKRRVPVLHRMVRYGRDPAL